MAPIAPMIEAIGASIINLSPYSPDFNFNELGWFQLKCFLRIFYNEIIDTLTAVALELINPQHLKNCFTKCC